VDTDIQKFLNGTYGCSRSHLKAWQLFLSTNHGSALVLEDDVVFPSLEDLESEIDRIKQLSIDIPMLVQLGWLELGRVGLARWLAAIWHALRFRGPRTQGFVRGFGFGTHCYLVKRSMARYLVQIVGGVPDYEGTSLDGAMDAVEVAKPSLLPLDKFIMTTLHTQAFDDCVVVRSLHNYALQEGWDSNITNTTILSAQNLILPGRTVKDRIRATMISLADAQGERTTLIGINETVTASR